MVSIPKHLKALEIEKRAARIRSQWSAAERVRRTGLPPDVPARLQEFILGRRQPQWCVVSPHQKCEEERLMFCRSLFGFTIAFRIAVSRTTDYDERCMS